jgi:hypothetical protein
MTLPEDSSAINDPIVHLHDQVTDGALSNLTFLEDGLYLNTPA